VESSPELAPVSLDGNIIDILPESPVVVGGVASAKDVTLQTSIWDIVLDYYFDMDDMVLDLLQLPLSLQGPFVILSFMSAGVGAGRLCWKCVSSKPRDEAPASSQHGCVRTLNILKRNSNHGAVWFSLVGMGYAGAQLFVDPSLFFLDVSVPTAVQGKSLTTNALSLVSVGLIEVGAVGSIILEAIALIKLLRAGSSTDRFGWLVARALVYILSMAFFCGALLGPTLKDPENSSDPIWAFVGILQRWVMLVYMARTGANLHERRGYLWGDAGVLRPLLPVTDQSSAAN